MNDKIIQQLKRGTLEIIILSLIKDKKCGYGYAIISTLIEKGGLFFRNTNAGTVYPLLYRLEKEGYISVDNSIETNQKKYIITKTGLEYYEQNIRLWNEYVEIFYLFTENKSH